MYSFQTRVRYSECNNHHEATLTALLDYLQDCCTFQSEDLGIGLDFLTENHTAWILSSWQVDILRYPKLGGIRAALFKGFQCVRNQRPAI